MSSAVEIYVIIASTLIAMIVGLSDPCRQYCELSLEHSTTPLDCNCSLHDLLKINLITAPVQIASPPDIKDSGIYYEPVQSNSSRNITTDEVTLHISNLRSNLDPEQNKSEDTENLKLVLTDISELFVERDNNEEYTSKSSSKYKRGDNDAQPTVGEAKVTPLHLYLDLDLNTSENSNTSQLEELKKMFGDFLNAEKDLSECIHLHIYIFSKYNEANMKTNSNWGQKVDYDNLSSSQELTEIQNKCNRPASIIKHSIYQIQQLTSREGQTAELVQDGEETVSNSANLDIPQIVTFNSQIYENTTTSDYTTATSYSNDVDANVAHKTVEINVENLNEIHRIRHTKDDNFNQFNNKNILDVESIEHDSSYENPIDYDRASTLTSTTTTADDYDDLGITSKTHRTVYSEEDMMIPKILTKELPNGTLSSVVDGFEEIPNADFVSNNVISTSETITSSTTPNQDVLKTNVDTRVQSELVEIRGTLYFLFGQKHIPARFIQQPDGELNVAIDGFSMCHQLLEGNTSNFISKLCKCIKQKQCKHSLHSL